DGSASGARNLNDEANEIIGDDNDQIAQATQAYEDNKEQDTQWLGTGVSSSSGSRSIASQSGGEGEVSSSSIESSIKDRALRSASERMNEMNRSTSDEAPVRDRAAEFMNNYNAFQDEMAKTISTSSPSESSTESVSIVNQEQLEAAQSEKERYDRLIADLEARL